MTEISNKIYRMIELSKFYIYGKNEKTHIDNLFNLANKLEKGKQDKVVKNRNET